MPANTLDSARLREKGNRFYKDAAEESGSTQLRLLELAESMYRKALDAADSADACASAHKNIAATLHQLANLAAGASSSSASQGVRLTSLREVVSHRCMAFQRGQAGNKSEDWCDSEWSSIQAVIEDLMEVLRAQLECDLAQCGWAVRQLELLVEAIPPSCLTWTTHAGICFLGIVKDVVATAISPAADAAAARRRTAAGGPDWRGCMRLLAETKRVLIESLQSATECEDAEDVEELLQLEDELWAMACRCESTQARLQADELLLRALRSSGQAATSDAGGGAGGGAAPAAGAAATPGLEQQAVQLEGVLAALDMYKQAALLARERDLQAEAQALSRLGHAFKVCAVILDPVLVPPGDDGLLKRNAGERCRDAFMRVLMLVDALPHRITLMMEDWYREARDTISEYQFTTAAQETNRREAERAPVREALKPELTALYAAANRGWQELLKHCYTTHPPINPANRVTDFSNLCADTGKEALRRAILAYHPDKRQPEPTVEVSMAWKVLAEEVTKELTRKYECFK